MQQPQHAPADLAKFIDHTLLKPQATAEQIRRLCQEALDNHFYSVCVNGCWVALARQILGSAPVCIASVVGFPLGAMSTPAKANETAVAVADGAREIDMVLNVGLLKDKSDAACIADIAAVVKAAAGHPVKVIIETCLLDEEEKRRACRHVVAAGAHFVKTSTGFSTGGATLEDVKLLRECVGPDFGVKASGGIRDAQTALAMIQAGASRIGTASGVAIIQGLR